MRLVKSLIFYRNLILALVWASKSRGRGISVFEEVHLDGRFGAIPKISDFTELESCLLASLQTEEEGKT